MIDNKVRCFLIIEMTRLRFPFGFILLSFWIYGPNLLAIDFNNTQANPKDINQALGWEIAQMRNGVLFPPNGEIPLSGFIKKVYSNAQLEVFVRVSGGKIDRIQRWKENGIPLFYADLIPGGLEISGIPESADKLDQKLFNGLTRFWFPSGQIMLEASYKIGKRDGLTRTWYENGYPKVEETYRDGLKDGNAKSWFENGQKWMDYTHWNDKRDGPLVWWYENGQKRQEGNYKGGMRFGEWTYYQEDGKILYRKTFRDGQPISTKYGEPSEDK